MPTSTYIALANITLGSSASSVTFSSIPATYRDLILIATHKLTTAGETLIYFNADTGSNYSSVTMRGGPSSSTFSASFTAAGIRPQNAVGGATASNDSFQLQVMDYSATDKHKATLLRAGNATTDFSMAHASRWANTGNITSIKCEAPYASGSTFALYAIVS